MEEKNKLTDDSGKEPELKEEELFDRDIESDLKINRFKLEDECSIHPSIFFHWAEQTPEKRKERDLLKRKLKATEANLQVLLRNGTKEITGISKLTEAAIQAAIECDSEVEKLNQELIQAEYELGQSQAREESMMQRKGNLDNLVKLYTKEYYSNPGESKFSGNDDASRAARKNLQRREKSDE